MDWTASLIWVNKARSQFTATFSLISADYNQNSTLRAIIPDKLQPLVPVEVATRWTFTLSDPSPKISSFSSTVASVVLSSELKKAGLTIPISSSTSHSTNTIYINSTLTIILVSKTLQTEVISDGSTPQQVSPSIAKVGEAITSVSKAATSGAAGVFFLGSTCSLNLGPAFIKLFQIIEILGKFYFTPIDFSSLMDFFLSKLFGLSDLIDTRNDILIGFPAHIPNQAFGKLTILNQQEYLLRANPIFVLIYPLFQLIELCLMIANKRRRPKSQKTGLTGRMLAIATTLRQFVFEMSFVDFAFYSSYSLMGLYRVGFFSSWEYLTNKLLGLYYLTHCTLFTVKVVHTAFTVKIDKTGIIDSKRYGHEYATIVSESICPSMMKIREVRMTNAMYIVSMMSFQVILTTFQNSPGPGVILLFGLSVFTFFKFIRITLSLNPFKSILDGAQRFSYELSLVTFIGAISLRKIGFYHPYEDYAVIGLVVVCILVQIVVTSKAMIVNIISIFKKRQPVANSFTTQSKSNIENNSTGYSPKTKKAEKFSKLSAKVEGIEIKIPSKKVPTKVPQLPTPTLVKNRLGRLRLQNTNESSRTTGASSNKPFAQSNRQLKTPGLDKRPGFVKGRISYQSALK